MTAYFGWQKYKYKFVENKLESALAKETDRLYVIKYDSLYFDEALGDAYVKNIHIYPDTNKIKNLSGEKMPYILLDIRINSINVTGVKSATAIAGQSIIGDSVVLDHPEIIIYTVRPLNKGTQIENEAKTVYQQILGNLDLIKFKYIFVNNVNLSGMDFFTKEKKYDLVNAKFKLDDLLIDSAHNNDSGRVLFCKQAAFTIDSFVTFNNNRKELNVADISFSGVHRGILLKSILLNRFDDSTSAPKKLLEAKTLSLSGVNTDAVVKNKNILVDSIQCGQITFYQPPAEDLKKMSAKNNDSTANTGFMRVYSIFMKHLNFPKVNFIPIDNSKYSLGNLSLEINDVKANQLLNVKNHPLDYASEVDISLSSLAMKSKDNKYDFKFNTISLNSLKKQLQIGSFKIIPYTGEISFAAREHFQSDRYDVSLSGIALNGIAMNDLLDNKLIADELIINNTVGKIYRDLTKPLEKKSKVGNYPSQLLKKLDMPVKVSKAVLRNAYIEYKEKEVVSDSTGVISFANSSLTISNITNMPDAIKVNSAMNINFDTRALNAIPLKGNFKFFLNNDNGNFEVNGNISPFNALVLNKVSVPMALIKVREGKINEIDFKLTGNNTSAKGDFVMKYDGLKINVLKRDKESKEVKKRGLLTFVANIIVKNDNPLKGELRKETPQYDRDIYKSFFNLIWKTVFDGMKKTVGVP
ncbi:MAG: hypothetical protein ABIP35_08560 [Ginsengibacter sp.]